MSLQAIDRKVVRFGLFEVDLQQRILTKGGLRIRLQDQPFQVFALLLERPGDLVSREEIRQRLWPADTYVAFDDGLNTAIKKLRAALSDTADNPRFIETVPRRGYRFIAPILSPQGSDFELAGAQARTPQSSDNDDEPAAGSLATTDSSGVHLPSRSSNRLRWILPAALLILLGAIALTIRARRNAVTSGEEFQAIAVLPLQNMSADPAQEYVADGMTDEIITDLAKLAGPKVISRTSAMLYKRTKKSIPEIARELNVGAIVEGSVESSNGRIRVRVQLIRASTDQHIWAEAYDRELKDVLHLEADLAKDIASEIQVHLTPQQQRNLVGRGLTNPQAFQDYLLGRQYWAMRTEESLHQAVEYFTRAIQEDPADARSYAGLAHCYIVLPMLTQVQFAESESKARAAAIKAIALDDSLAEAHLAMAEVKFYQDWDFAAAEREFHRTLELNPNYATGHQWYGEYLSVFGRHQEAIHELETAIALDPLSAIVHHQAGQTFREARQYDRAIQEYQRALKLNPDLYVSYEAMYWAYRRQGRFEEAARAMQGALPYWRADAGMDEPLRELPLSVAKGGREGFLRQSIEIHKHFRDGALYLARDYADLGDREEAFNQLARTFKENLGVRIWILTDVEFDSFRSEPRFQSLVAAIQSPRAD